LELFSPEHIKSVIEVFGDLLAVQTDPNPLASGLATIADAIIEQVYDRFDTAGMRLHYGNVLRMLASRHELISSFLTIDSFKRLSTFINNAVFDISSEAISVTKEILISENPKIQEAVSTTPLPLPFYA
jgi:hypothetical protein